MKQKKRGLSEKQIGYLMVLPALLIILVIAIWPVVRSFWISLYDVRLNDPAKTQIHLQHGVNVEKVAEIYPVLTKNLEDASQKADADTKQRLTAIREQVEGIKARLDKSADFAKKYEKVDELLFNGDPVPEELTFASLDKAKGNEVQKQLMLVQNDLKKLADEKRLKDDTLPGLSKGLGEAFIAPNFIGFDYYAKLLQEKRLWDSLGNTILFTVISVFLELVLGLWIAMLINRQFIGRGLVRAAVLIPWAIPTVISALMWKFMFDGQNGILAKIFEQIGIVSNMGALLTTKAGSMFAVIFADVWKTTPFMALLLLAGLQTISSSLYEAAEVDGASRSQQFFRITLPLLKPTILVALLFRTLDAFRVFDLIYVLTGGGPANSTETISIYAYKTMFAQMNFGEGSALSVIVFICVAIISMIFVKLLGTDLVSDGREK
ncbi:ABC transporter permease subunit [Paenactinomyces guangxiensis]|uniref:ABC transporter permease subunit n=1 Tax=Paenactinomyces guangxiensis TaxID=1490290 RepID=A0A7W1WN48_9BACL|nr:sugar ABC transporter permease [Paenactinomyces guangxiensis]MBA4492851.1 ABC transporter permease subunit [Paenactinomyces guangxiensis]MBH8590300.1 ABC transporter permease subunit [Paenactinomyces guangxiensis]